MKVRKPHRCLKPSGKPKPERGMVTVSKISPRLLAKSWGLATIGNGKNPTYLHQKPGAKALARGTRHISALLLYQDKGLLAETRL